MGTISHPLIIAVSLPLTALAWGRGRRGQSDALLLLALLLLLRCVLDTWDTVYYPIPFVLALLAWESLGERRRPAVLALSSTVLAWVSFHVAARAYFRRRAGGLLPGLVLATRGGARRAAVCTGVALKALTEESPGSGP